MKSIVYSKSTFIVYYVEITVEDIFLTAIILPFLFFVKNSGNQMKESFDVPHIFPTEVEEGKDRFHRKGTR